MLLQHPPESFIVSTEQVIGLLAFGVFSMAIYIWRQQATRIKGIHDRLSGLEVHYKVHNAKYHDSTPGEEEHGENL
jgi:predicted ferric reductase